MIHALEHAHSLGHETPNLYCQLAEAYSATNSTAPAAEAVYREALRADPDNPAFLHGISALLAAQNRTDPDATALLERAHHRDSADIVIGTQYTRALVANGRLDEAIRVVRYLLQHDKENGELQKLYAQASLGSNRIDEAIRQYEHLLRQHPGDREATVNLAAALAQKQATDDASAGVYERALALDPGNAEVRLIYARHHAIGGRVARALEEFRKAVQSSPSAGELVAGEVRGLIAVAPERVDLRWFLAHMLLDEGNMKDAMVQLDAIFESDPTQMNAVLQAYDTILGRDANQPLACLRKGVLLKAQGRFEEARPFLQRAYQLVPSHPEAIRELAGLYDHILQETDDVEVRFLLGKLCYTQNDHDSAIGHFQRTVQDFRYENESIKMLGLCFVGKGMLEFALQEFKKLVIDDEMKEILYDLAQRYETKNDLVGAKQVYRLLFAADITYRNVKAEVRDAGRPDERSSGDRKHHHDDPAERAGAPTLRAAAGAGTRRDGHRLPRDGQRAGRDGRAEDPAGQPLAATPRRCARFAPRHAKPAGSPTPTSCASTTSARRWGASTSRWSSSRDTT